MRRVAVFLIITLVLTSRSFAVGEDGLSLNLGSKNPPDTNLGLNLMYKFGDWAVEMGLGRLRGNENGNVLVLAGAMNGKYMYMVADWLRPYAQVGASMAFSARGRGINFDLGESFYGGLGAFIFVPGFYFYGSYNVGGSEGSFPQGGFGMQL